MQQGGAARRCSTEVQQEVQRGRQPSPVRGGVPQHTPHILVLPRHEAICHQGIRLAGGEHQLVVAAGVFRVGGVQPLQQRLRALQGAASGLG